MPFNEYPRLAGYPFILPILRMTFSCFMIQKTFPRLIVFAAALTLGFAGAVAGEPAKSALDTDPNAWVDIMPPPTLNGWVRVPYQPEAKLTRQQWHVDNGLLTCDGDGGHDMLLLNRQIANSIFHVEFCFTKINNPKAAYNSGVWVRTLLDGSIWHQAQVKAWREATCLAYTQTPAGPKDSR